MDLTDSDNDGLPDFYEDKIVTDENRVSDDLEDLYNDGLTDIEEYRLKINSRDSDTGGDGLNDSLEN